MASQYDVVIRSGSIMDGNGGAPFVGDIAVKDEKLPRSARSRARARKRSTPTVFP